jgi:hypothetical protein
MENSQISIDFLEYYNLIKLEFESNSNFTILIENKGKFDWPDKSGVYVIWERKDTLIKNLIYIGMTGKFLKNMDGELNFNNASFKSRLNRWTPYRFCEKEKDEKMKHHFRFGPKESKTSLQAQIRYDLEAYQTSIAYNKLEIHCFTVDENNNIYTPVLLESLLLTKYLKTTGHLPPANNSL